MKNKSIVLMLALAGLVGCRGGNADDANSGVAGNESALMSLVKKNGKKPTQKDTVIVLGCKSRSPYIYMSAVDKNGNIFLLQENFNENSIATNPGDTLVLSQVDWYGSRVVSRNLTMENKIKEIVSASKQR